MAKMKFAFGWRQCTKVKVVVVLLKFILSESKGTCRIFASVYKWKETDKVVISDIDGTITKSDLMGYIFPTIGKDWTQEGVTKLYKRVNDNGYKFMYLSSRAIGQSSMTKGYLDSVSSCLFIVYLFYLGETKRIDTAPWPSYVESDLAIHGFPQRSDCTRARKVQD